GSAIRITLRRLLRDGDRWRSCPARRAAVPSERVDVPYGRRWLRQAWRLVENSHHQATLHFLQPVKHLNLTRFPGPDATGSGDFGGVPHPGPSGLDGSEVAGKLSDDDHAAPIGWC
ncbi:MAG: hypothetical protein Q9173_005841, partial [Seirophora scorigena]